jgi:uncharacterized protein (DUF2236 family)
MAIASTGWLAPVREVPATAHRFVCYMNAMERSGQKLNFWDRVTYGLALAGAPEKATRPVGRI